MAKGPAEIKVNVIAKSLKPDEPLGAWLEAREEYDDAYKRYQLVLIELGRARERLEEAGIRESTAWRELTEERKRLIDELARGASSPRNGSGSIDELANKLNPGAVVS